MPFYSNIPYSIKQTAIFAEANFKLGERASLAVGGRYYDFSEDRILTFGGLFSDPSAGPGSTDSDGFLPRALFSYDFNDNVQLNAQDSEGFRLGGINDPLNLRLCSPQDVATFGESTAVRRRKSDQLRARREDRLRGRPRTVQHLRVPRGDRRPAGGDAGGHLLVAHRDERAEGAFDGRRSSSCSHSRPITSTSASTPTSPESEVDSGQLGTVMTRGQPNSRSCRISSCRPTRPTAGRSRTGSRASSPASTSTSGAATRRSRTRRLASEHSTSVTQFGRRPCASDRLRRPDDHVVHFRSADAGLRHRQPALRRARRRLGGGAVREQRRRRECATRPRPGARARCARRLPGEPAAHLRPHVPHGLRPLGARAGPGGAAATTPAAAATPAAPAAASGRRGQGRRHGQQRSLPGHDAGCPVDAIGCFKEVTLRGVLFDMNSEELDCCDQVAARRRAAANYKRLPPDVAAQTRVSIEGHTDSTGSDAYNNGLSQRRADTVRAVPGRRRACRPRSLRSSARASPSRPTATTKRRPGQQPPRGDQGDALTGHVDSSRPAPPRGPAFFMTGIERFPAGNAPFVIFLRRASRSHRAQFVTVPESVAGPGTHRLVPTPEFSSCRPRVTPQSTP